MRLKMFNIDNLPEFISELYDKNILNFGRLEKFKDIKFGYKSNYYIYDINKNTFEYNINNLVNSRQTLIETLKNKSKIFCLASLTSGNYIFIYDKNINQITAYFNYGVIYNETYEYLFKSIEDFLNISHDFNKSKSVYDLVNEIRKRYQKHIPDIISNMININFTSIVELNITETFINYLIIQEIKDI